MTGFGIQGRYRVGLGLICGRSDVEGSGLMALWSLYWGNFKGVLGWTVTKYMMLRVQVKGKRKVDTMQVLDWYEVGLGLVKDTSWVES